MQSSMWRKVSSNKGKLSKISSHRAKQQRHQLNFITVQQNCSPSYSLQSRFDQNVHIFCKTGLLQILTKLKSLQKVLIISAFDLKLMQTSFDMVNQNVGCVLPLYDPWNFPGCLGTGFCYVKFLRIFLFCSRPYLLLVL